MRLVVRQQFNVHKDIATAVGWNAANELYSCADDKKVWRWNSDGEPLAEVATFDTYVTDMHWYPSKKGGSDFFVISCTDGISNIAAELKLSRLISDRQQDRTT